MVHNEPMNKPIRFFRRAILFCPVVFWFWGGAVNAFTPVSVLEGKLTLELEEGFVEGKDHGSKVIASFKARKGDAWGTVTRGKRGLEPAALAAGEHGARAKQLIRAGAFPTERP